MLRGLAVACALAVVGCTSTRPLTVRTDPTVLPSSNRLSGLRVSVIAVHDARVDPTSLGVHRDGLARVTQYGYTSRSNLSVVVGSLLAQLALASGASVVAPDEHADLRFAVDILELDLTTDGIFAGEETFGRARLRLTAFGRDGRAVWQQTVSRAFSDDEYADPGLLGDGLRDALAQALASMPIPVPVAEVDPDELAARR